MPCINSRVRLLSDFALFCQQVLLTHGARVYVAARNKTQAEDTIRELKQETGNEAIFLNLDLANLEAVKAAAEEFLRFVCSPRTNES